MIALRELTEKDIPILNKWRNDKNISDFLVTNYTYINIETDIAWFKKYLNERDNNCRFSIIDAGKDSEDIVGVVYLTEINWINRNACVGIIIGDDQQNKGYGTEAIKLIVNHAFNNLNLHRVYAYILEYNDRSVKIFEKNNFVLDGVLKEAIFKNGKYHNLSVYSLINNL